MISYSPFTNVGRVRKHLRQVAAQFGAYPFANSVISQATGLSPKTVRIVVRYLTTEGEWRSQPCPVPLKEDPTPDGRKLRRGSVLVELAGCDVSDR